MSGFLLSNTYIQGRSQRHRERETETERLGERERCTLVALMTAVTGSGPLLKAREESESPRERVRERERGAH